MITNDTIPLQLTRVLFSAAMSDDIHEADDYFGSGAVNAALLVQTNDEI